MKKMDKNFITDSFEEVKGMYRDAVSDIGLWKSERYVFKKYLKSI